MFALACLLGLTPASATADGGPILHLDASDRSTLTLAAGRISAWRSKAPGSAVLTAEAAAARPEYLPASGGNPASVRFDGHGNALRALGFGRKAKTWTLAVLASAASDVRGGGLVSACNRKGHDYDPGFTVDLFHSRGRLDEISVEGAGRMAGQLNQMKGGHPAGGLHVIVVERAPDQIRLRVDGAPQTPRPASPAVTIMDELRVGARYFAGAEREYLSGRIAGVLLYDRLLSSDEISRIEARWAVPAAARQADEERTMRKVKERMANRMVAPVTLESWPDLDTYAATTGGKAALTAARKAPVRADLQEAIALASMHLNSLFNRDKDDEPYFYANHKADNKGVMLHSVVIGIPHVVGRCLLGSMMAERLAGTPFPPAGLATLERYLRGSFDNEDHLNSYYDPEKGNRRFVEFHNMREGLYGLVMLIQDRESDWAREKAGLMLRTLDAVTDEKGEWSVELLRKRGMADRCSGISVMNASRMVDPLLALHRATDDPLALKLAGLYAKASLRTGFEPDGRFAPMDRSSGHVHSITSSLSGITEYALFIGDKAMLETCLRILDKGVPSYFSSWGWGDEVTPEHPADEPSRGEMNQTGDVIRTCLTLGAAGQTDRYEMAERYLRSMVLPTQHREGEMRAYLHDAPRPASDAERNVLLRTVGGWAMQLPNDRMKEGDWPLSTLDITSGTLHAMAECQAHIVTDDGAAVSLNLHLSADTPLGVVRSGLPLEGRLTFVARLDRAVRVRIPQWVDAKRLAIRVNREAVKPKLKGGYAELGRLRPGDQVEVVFPVPVRIERERVDHVTYRTVWAGAQILQITPRGKVSPLPW